jgi:hypothetical protein
MCDVEQRLNTENINLATQSSKESFSALHCGNFNQFSRFLRAFNAPGRQRQTGGRGQAKPPLCQADLHC